MICKFCGKEVAEEEQLCPYCGKELRQEQQPETEQVTPPEEQAEIPAAEPEEIPEAAVEAEAPSEPAEPREKTEIKEGIHMTPGKLALTIAAAVVVLAVLVALIVSGLSRENGKLSNTEDSDPAQSTEQTQPEETEETAPPTIPADGNPDDATCKGSYTVTDDEARALNSQVVATMGDVELNNGTLQVYYWMEVFSFLQQYGSYASYFGLDMNQPLDTQLCDLGETNMTWQQYFLGAALESWHCFEAMRCSAEDNGFRLSAEAQESLDTLADQIKTTAEENGFADVNDLVKENVGAGALLEDYVRYIATYTMGYEYYDSLCNALTATDAEIEAYFAENEESFAQTGITKDTRYVDVRHILFQPEGGTTDENGTTTYSEEEWEACRVKAQDVLNQYLAGEQTQEAFAALATELSEDPGSQSNGGLYTSVAEGQMVEPFENWCFDEGRKIGDTGLVQTSYGYHVMYFAGSNPAWIVNSRQQLLDSKASAIVPEAMEQYPIKVDYSSIALALVDMSFVQ